MFSQEAEPERFDLGEATAVRPDVGGRRETQLDALVRQPPLVEHDDRAGLEPHDLLGCEGLRALVMLRSGRSYVPSSHDSR